MFTHFVAEYYLFINLPAFAPFEEVQKAITKLSQEPLSNEQQSLLKEVSENLSDEEKKKEYDASLHKKLAHEPDIILRNENRAINLNQALRATNCSVSGAFALVEQNPKYGAAILSSEKLLAQLSFSPVSVVILLHDTFKKLAAQSYIDFEKCLNEKFIATQIRKLCFYSETYKALIEYAEKEFTVAVVLVKYGTRYLNADIVQKIYSAHEKNKRYPKISKLLEKFSISNKVSLKTTITDIDEDPFKAFDKVSDLWTTKNLNQVEPFELLDIFRQVMSVIPENMEFMFSICQDLVSKPNRNNVRSIADSVLWIYSNTHPQDFNRVRVLGFYIEALNQFTGTYFVDKIFSISPAQYVELAKIADKVLFTENGLLKLSTKNIFARIKSLSGLIAQLPLNTQKPQFNPEILKQKSLRKVTAEDFKKAVALSTLDIYKELLTILSSESHEFLFPKDMEDFQSPVSAAVQVLPAVSSAKNNELSKIKESLEKVEQKLENMRESFKDMSQKIEEALSMAHDPQLPASAAAQILPPERKEKIHQNTANLLLNLTILLSTKYFTELPSELYIEILIDHIKQINKEIKKLEKSADTKQLSEFLFQGMQKILHTKIFSQREIFVSGATIDNLLWRANRSLVKEPIKTLCTFWQEKTKDFESISEKYEQRTGAQHDQASVERFLKNWKIMPNFFQGLSTALISCTSSYSEKLKNVVSEFKPEFEKQCFIAAHFNAMYRLEKILDKLKAIIEHHGWGDGSRGLEKITRLYNQRDKLGDFQLFIKSQRKVKKRLNQGFADALKTLVVRSQLTVYFYTEFKKLNHLGPNFFEDMEKFLEEMQVKLDAKLPKNSAKLSTEMRIIK